MLPGALDFWLGTQTFQQADHVPALYRMAAADLGGSTPYIWEKGEPSPARDAVAEALGFPSPFGIVNLNDRRGIWQTDPPIVKQLGEDPSKELRQVHVLTHSGVDRKAVAPVGLRNLGATCYLNSLLQYLFFNADFRNSLLQATSESEVVHALQKVFALMSAGKRNIVDPSEFIRVAGVDAVEQEDATEFSTLLLDWLERALSKGQEQTHKGGFIPSLFQGEVAQLLTCLEKPDHFFERREPFYELRARLTLTCAASNAASFGEAASDKAAVPRRGARAHSPPPLAATVAERPVPPVVPELGPVAGGASASAAAAKRAAGSKRKEKGAAPLVNLEELLAETTFPDEMLSGANRYHCPRCDKKVDARKSIRLAKPPPYLHITIERYHYDLQKGERKKLNNPVSFPQHLRLRPCGAAVLPGARELPGGGGESLVVYDCVGYLEHVSDSAHSGHYTATLYQDDEDAAEALELASGDGELHRSPSADADAGRSGADAAAGVPRGGFWWTLDDYKVSPVLWRGPRAVAAGQAAGAAEGGRSAEDIGLAPTRIESASAYLILYRRRDYSRSHRSSLGAHCPRMPVQLAAEVSAENSKLARAHAEYMARSSAVETFLKERRLAVNSLIHALREVSQKHTSPAVAGSSDTDPFLRRREAPETEEAFDVVPAAWLDRFLRGDDRMIRDLLEGRTRPAPVTYGRSLLKRSNPECQALDPLALWCGEVKLLPAEVLLKVGGVGGLDASMFLRLGDATATAACRAAWTLHGHFRREWLQIRKILEEGKVSAAEARSWHEAGRGNEAVWVAMRVQKRWSKVVSTTGATAKSSLPWQLAALRAFLREVQEARWFGRGLPEEPAQDEVCPDGPKPTQPAHAVGAATGTRLESCEVNLTSGLLCDHGLVNNPRAGFLARRAEVELLLEISRDKELAYVQLWPHLRAVPQLRSGLAGGELLSFGDTCPTCRGDPGAGSSMQDALATAGQRQLNVKRRYPSGVTRRQGTVVLPDAANELATAGSLRRLVREQLGLPVARLFREALEGETCLQDNELLDDALESIIVEKDETVAPSREATAFQGSIFRSSNTVSVA